jgi:nucleotide-binding universal stress UspA family protein
MNDLDLGLDSNAKIFTMKKMIVPIDFSDVSRNAAYYAAQLAADIPGCEIVLYNVYDKYAAGSDGSLMSADGSAEKIITLAALRNVQMELILHTPAAISILAEEGSLAENLELLVGKIDAQLVVMGINGSTRLEQILIGSNTLNVLKKGSFPLLVIPPGAKYNRITKAVFASDFIHVEQTTPIKSLRRMLDIFRPELHVLHIDEFKTNALGDSFKQEKEKMDELLVGLNPQYDFLETNNFTKSISDFVKREKVNLIITVPRYHSFLNDLFTTTHTEKLVYHTDVPILAVHE